MGQVVKVATVFIYINNDLVLGQEGVKVTQTVDKVEQSSKADFPNKIYVGGWNDGNAECNGLMNVGSGGLADLMITQLEGVTVPIKFIDEDSGEQMTGQALMTEVSADAPKDKTPTVSCKLEKSGAWEWVAGS